MVLCKTCEAIIGELICVVFLFLCVVKLRDGVEKTGLCNFSRLRNLSYQM